MALFFSYRVAILDNDEILVIRRFVIYTLVLDINTNKLFKKRIFIDKATFELFRRFFFKH